MFMVNKPRVSRFFYLPTDAQLNCLESNFKIYTKIDIKTAPTCFGAITPSSESALFDLAKVTVVKIINQNTLISVLWPHRCILIGYFNDCNFSKIK
jgi:hypothetical protein